MNQSRLMTSHSLDVLLFQLCLNIFEILIFQLLRIFQILPGCLCQSYLKNSFIVHYIWILMQVYCIPPCYTSLSNFSPPCVNTYNLYCILVEIYYSIRSLSILNTIRPREDFKYSTFLLNTCFIIVFYDHCSEYPNINSSC